MDLIRQFNNGQVIGVANRRELENMGHVDAPLLRQLDFTDHRQSLGLINLFENLHLAKVPFLRDAIKNADYIYVNGIRGTFDYEVPLDIELPTVVEDVNDEDFPGIDGSTFEIKLSHPFRQGDILTYDPIDGVQVVVSEDYDVTDVGNGWIHTVTLASNNREEWFPKDKLIPGTSFGKLDHVAGEYSTQFSGVTGVQTPSTVKLEYQLGDIRGVEMSYTAYANSMTINGKDNSQMFENMLRTKKNMFGDHELLFTGELRGKNQVKVNRVEDIIPLLGVAELQKMTAMGLMFNRGAVVTGVNGSKRINEGIYHQLRRGHRWVYSNLNELRALIQKAVDVIFQGSPLPLEQRVVVFKAGKLAYDQVRQMFKEEFTSTYPIFLDQSGVPVKLLEGTDRYNLTYKTFAIQEAFLNGIGNVRVEHDPSMDYDFGDFVSRGYSAGFSKRTWSLVIWDATDPAHSNVLDSSLLPKGVEIDQKSMGNNLYLIKPKGMADINWGTTTGRMAGQNVKSSMAHMSEEFWAWSSLSAWVMDLSRVVLIERDDTYEFGNDKLYEAVQ